MYALIFTRLKGTIIIFPNIEIIEIIGCVVKMLI
jgi:hypothetical protein